ncbi:MAG: replicative DNA helicase [bacterium]
MADIRLPPQNLDAEKSVLGSVLIDEEAIYKIVEILKPENFYHPHNKEIFSAMLELFNTQKAIDILTLSDLLKKNKMLSKVGGMPYLTELAAVLPISAHLEEYAHIVKETSIRRKLISLGAKFGESAYEEQKKLADVLNECESGIFEITEDNIKKDFVHVSKLLEEAYENVEDIDKSKDKVAGVKTGFTKLDNLIGGFQKSDLIILGARPSVGKTSLALDVARHAAVKGKANVGFFSLEMSNMQLMYRLLSMQTGANLWDLRMGHLTDKQFEVLPDALGILSESNLYIDDTPGASITEIRTKARRLKMEKGLDIIFIDYLQLVTGNNKENRVQEVSDISRQLKNIARELDIPVIALSQLNRAVESRNDRRPQLSDLRESGSIEQDADIVMFLHREEMYNQQTENKGTAELIIAKHRNGPTGTIDLFFVKEQARYRELDKQH